MRVDAIKSLVREFQHYKKDQKSPSAFWEMMVNFQKNWCLKREKSHLPDMFNKSLQSSIDRSLWKRTRYYPKQMMELFLANHPEYCIQAFNELFDSDLDVEVRIDRFKFYSDQMLELYKKDNPLTMENNHYQDTEIISLYLFLQAPEAYPVYNLVWLRLICELTYANPIPEHHDISRFYKISKILKKFLQEDELLKTIYLDEIAGLRLNFCKPMETYVPLADFYTYCSTKHNLSKK